MSPLAPTYYRLAPSMVARLAGAGLVTTAAFVLLATLVSSVLDVGPAPILVVALVGLVGVVALTWWLAERAYVVRLDTQGYEVRVVRGAGVTRARWADVAEASTAEVRGAACLVLALRNGRTTTVPVVLLAADRDDFLAEVRNLLRNSR